MIRVLVTGSDGQLGKCIQKISGSFTSVELIFKDRDNFDITDSKKTAVIFKKGNFDFCINCAAYTYVEQAEKTPEKAYLINTEGVKNLSLACRANEVVLIHISTDYVFDGEKETPYAPDDRPNPINQYGVSKLKGERYIQEILNRYFIIRTSWLYSEFGPNFLTTMIRLGKRQDSIDVVADQEGSPTYALDLAKALLEIILSDNTHYGIFHYAPQGKTTWSRFAKEIFELLNIKVTVNPVPSDKFSSGIRRPKYSVLDTKLTEEIWKIKLPSWQDALKRCIGDLS